MAKAIALGLGTLSALACLAGAESASAALLRVPQQHATIQEAVDAAAAGDEIRVAAGSHCGATIDKRVTLRGVGGATIIGCETGPAFTNGARIGFFLPGTAGTSGASGTRISGFTFDGRGISTSNLEPLAFGVFGRFAADVFVGQNRFLGTVQAVTNTGGDRWFIWQNRITGLTVFDCTGICTGGDAIVIQLARAPVGAPGGNAAAINRPEGNIVLGNRISGSVPDNFDVFGMVGVLVLAADRTVISGNRISIPDNPTADAPGQGVLITNVCCGDFTPNLPGARNTVVVFNDASRSEDGFVVEGTGGQNTEGLVLLHNRGSVIIEGAAQAALAARSAGAAPLTKERYF
jgi:nitrous oxidase accessory protein NosD